MLTQIINKYKSDTPKLITFEELRLFILDSSGVVNDNGIIITKIHESGDSLGFRVEMNKHNKWNLHLHDCWEVIIVYKGVCIDWVNKKKIEEKEQAIIKPNTLHEIECLTDEAILYVEFKKHLKK